MPVRIVRLGAPRQPDDGLRIGTVRRPPRGVRREGLRRERFFDVWLPELAPSSELVSWIKSQAATRKHWKEFERRYRREMKVPISTRLLMLLAELSRQTNFSVGCYCEDESRCHRRILRDLLVERGAQGVG